MTIAWKDLVLVTAGGAVGSAARYLVGRAMGTATGARIPWHTMTVNVTGAFVIGLMVVVAARSGWPSWWRSLIAVGVLGGYTTFSALSLETVELALTGHPVLALAYSSLSLLAGVAGAFAGIMLGRAFA